MEKPEIQAAEKAKIEPAAVSAKADAKIEEESVVEPNLAGQKLQDVLEQKAVTPIPQPIAQKNIDPVVTPAPEGEEEKNPHSPQKAEIKETPKPEKLAEQTDVIKMPAPVTSKTDEKVAAIAPIEETQEEKIAEPTKKESAADILPVKEIGTPAAIPVESDAETKAQKERLASIEKSCSQIRIWEAKRGSSLKRTLQKWASEMQMELVWHPKSDPDLNQNVLISGNFETAIKVVLSQAVKNAPSYFIDKTEGRLVVE